LGEEFQCGVCYECQVCVQCEKYGGGRMAQQMPPVQRQIRAPQPVMPQPQMQFQPLTEERVREIILEMLIQYGLVKGSERRRELR